MKKKVTILSIVMMLLTVLVGIHSTVNSTVISKLIANGYSRTMFFALIACNFAYAILETTKDIAARKTVNTVYFEYKTRLTKICANSDTSAINKISIGTIINNVNKISEAYGARFVTIVDSLSCVIPLGIMIWKIRSSMVSVVVLVISFVVSSIFYVWGNEKFKFTEKEQAASSRLESVLVDGLENILTLKYARKFSYFFGKVSKAADESYKHSTNWKKRAWFGFCQAISYIPLCVLAYNFRWNAEVLSYVFINEYVIYNAISKCIDVAAYSIKIKSAEKELECLDGSDIAEKTNMPSQMTISGTFNYGKDSAVFTVNNVTINRCSRYLITGASGEGKSSFGNLIAGAIKSEEIFGLPENLNTYYVFQETTLLNDTLRNNVSFGDETVTDEEILNLLDDLNMIDDLKNAFRGTDGKPKEREELLDSLVGSRGFKLSTGLKQRVLIARSIVEMRREPSKIFILDEITSNLDKKNRDTVIKLIDRECHSTLLIISHNEGFDSICNNHITVKDHIISPE